jgi:hypothetical protein
MSEKFIKFDLKVTVQEYPQQQQDPYYSRGMVEVEKMPELVEVEKMEFTSLSPVEVMRKVLDYMR